MDSPNNNNKNSETEKRSCYERLITYKHFIRYVIFLTTLQTAGFPNFLQKIAEFFFQFLRTFSLFVEAHV